MSLSIGLWYLIMCFACIGKMWRYAPWLSVPTNISLIILGVASGSYNMVVLRAVTGISSKAANEDLVDLWPLDCRVLDSHCLADG